MDWSTYYPRYFDESGWWMDEMSHRTDSTRAERHGGKVRFGFPFHGRQVSVLDVGCGYGGLSGVCYSVD